MTVTSAALHLNYAPIDLDLVPVRIDLDPHLRDHLAVDRDPPGSDNLLRGAPGSHPGPGEKFL